MNKVTYWYTIFLRSDIISNIFLRNFQEIHKYIYKIFKKLLYIFFSNYVFSNYIYFASIKDGNKRFVKLCLYTF